MGDFTGDGELLLILEDATDDGMDCLEGDYVPENNVFSYDSTKLITFVLKSDLMDEVKSIWDGGEMNIISEELYRFASSLHSITCMMNSNVDYFAVEWHNDQNETSKSMSLVLHGGGNVHNPEEGCLENVINTKEYAELLQAGEHANLESFKCHSIESKSDFRTTLKLMCEYSTTFMTDMEWLWAFHGWSK